LWLQISVIDIYSEILFPSLHLIDKTGKPVFQWEEIIAGGVVLDLPEEFTTRGIIGDLPPAGHQQLPAPGNNM